MPTLRSPVSTLPIRPAPAANLPAPMSSNAPSNSVRAARSSTTSATPSNVGVDANVDLSVTSGPGMNESPGTAAGASANVASIPDAMRSLSTAGLVNAAFSSTPMALAVMNDIARAAASGTPSAAEREAMRAAYAQASQQVVAAVGSADAGAQTSSSTTSGRSPDPRPHPASAAQHGAGTEGAVATRTPAPVVDVPASTRTVRHDPVQQVVTTTATATLVPDGDAARSNPRVDFRTHELHVGADSYEPVSTRQSQIRFDAPAGTGRVEHHAWTHRILVAQVAQITQSSPATALSAVA